MHIKTLRQLFEHQLQDLYSAETQIISALPKMIDKSNDEELSSALADHLEVTKEQLRRLEDISKDIDFHHMNHTCQGMKGILAEGEAIVNEVSDPYTKDAAIIVAAQKVEHYEIATYGSSIEFAKQLDLGDIAGLLKDSLDEEEEADDALSTLAEGWFFSKGINEKAAE